MGRVLIVDDDRDIRGTLADLLRGEGYDVIEASNGQQALRELISARNRPSLMLLDLMMPGMQGEALLEVLRDVGLLSELDIVVLTASRTKSVSGVRRVLHKPFALMELLEVVATYCDASTRPDLETVPPSTEPSMPSVVRARVAPQHAPLASGDSVAYRRARGG